jgi:hypothetical protein
VAMSLKSPPSRMVRYYLRARLDLRDRWRRCFLSLGNNASISFGASVEVPMTANIGPRLVGLLNSCSVFSSTNGDGVDITYLGSFLDRVRKKIIVTICTKNINTPTIINPGNPTIS